MPAKVPAQKAFFVELLQSVNFEKEESGKIFSPPGFVVGRDHLGFGALRNVENRGLRPSQAASNLLYWVPIILGSYFYTLTPCSRLMAHGPWTSKTLKTQCFECFTRPWAVTFCSRWPTRGTPGSFVSAGASGANWRSSGRPAGPGSTPYIIVFFFQTPLYYWVPIILGSYFLYPYSMLTAHGPWPMDE